MYKKFVLPVVALGLIFAGCAQTEEDPCVTRYKTVYNARGTTNDMGQDAYVAVCQGNNGYFNSNHP